MRLLFTTIALLLLLIQQPFAQAGVGVQPPPLPLVGDLWSDTTAGVLKRYNGAGWDIISSPPDATYLTQTANGLLTAEQAMGALATGLVINTTTTGVQSIYGGTTCTNQFPRGLNASGAATCESVTDADVPNTVTLDNLTQVTTRAISDTTGTLAVSRGGTNLTTSTDDSVMMGNGTTWESKAVPDCDTASTSKLLYDTATNTFSCGTDQTAGGGPTFTVLAADLTKNSATLSEVTGINTTLVAGLWEFKYYVRYRSDTATVGVKYSVNFTGTQTVFLANCQEIEGTTAASTGAADQQHAAFGLVAGGTQRAPSSSTACIGTISVDTINVDLLIIIEGIVRVTASGDLELWHANETGTTVITTKADTVLIATKLQ